jgi:hypothetical protein
MLRNGHAIPRSENDEVLPIYTSHNHKESWSRRGRAVGVATPEATEPPLIGTLGPDRS